jgi:protocatechuate 3,4-dioxygenase alpha subunit
MAHRGDNALGQTPSQTVGPFFAYALTPGQHGCPLPALAGPQLAGEAARGERIRLQGRVLDGEGAPVDDALLELWQADADGHLPPADPGFAGYGRCGTGTDPQARFTFHTVKPGGPGGGHAPHLSLVVFARGLLSHLYTRVYFADEERANARDPVLAQVPADRRATLLATRTETAAGPLYRFDVHLQGADETVFFDL